MSNYSSLQKLLKQGSKIEIPANLTESLQKQISETYLSKYDREFYFLATYYGLCGKALTLENIGQTQEQPLTRERIRQIINSAIITIKNLKNDKYENSYLKANRLFNEILEDKNFIRLEDILNNEFFSSFSKNTKGLISFLNDCDIRQIAYRKNYYFYPIRYERKSVIDQIQKQNKNIRRTETVKKMSLKSKTVTYVPNEVRTHLLSYATTNKINLNPLYEAILLEFISKKPFNNSEYLFARTKSWKARKGKAQWQQIGIYINKEIFDDIKLNVNFIKENLKKNVSLMSFICQAFVWHYEKNKT